MTVGLTEPEFDLRRWAGLMFLLSMDVVRPFYAMMGLQPDEPDALQRVLRQEIVAGRKRSAASLEAAPPFEPQAVLRAVAELLGAKTSQHLVWWDRHVFSWETRDNRNLNNWTTVLQNCWDEPGLWNRLGLPDSIRPDQFRRSRNIDEYEQRQDEVDARPLSDWDLHLYAIQLYDDNLYREPYHVPDGPRLYVKPTVRAYQSYQFWDAVLRSAGSDQLERLWQEARRIVEKEELSWVRDLPHPSALRILR